VSNTPTFMTIDEFSALLKISPKTTYSWIAAGRLVDGRHVVRLGRRILRIVWSEELLTHLHTQNECENQERPKLVRNGTGGRNRCALDPDYLEH